MIDSSIKMNINNYKRDFNNNDPSLTYSPDSQWPSFGLEGGLCCCLPGTNTASSNARDSVGEKGHHVLHPSNHQSSKTKKR